MQQILTLSVGIACAAAGWFCFLQMRIMHVYKRDYGSDPAQLAAAMQQVKETPFIFW